MIIMLLIISNMAASMLCESMSIAIEFKTTYVIEAKLCFSIFGKNLKTQNGRHFGRGNFF